MVTHVVDDQVVSGVDSALFSMVQQAPTGAIVTIVNTGTNTMNYSFQEFNGNTWADMSAGGTLLHNTLTGFQGVAMSVVSNYPQVRLMGYASGGTTLSFCVDRYAERPSGGSLPILSL